MRCAAKDSYPGCYDISSAGHIPAGDEFVGSALRELREELGVTLPADALQECGVRHFTFEDVFHGRLFKDNQVSKVFCLWLDKDAEDFTVQKEEIDYVRWFGLEEAIEAVKNNTITNCIYLDDLEMVAAVGRCEVQVVGDMKGELAVLDDRGEEVWYRVLSGALSQVRLAACGDA